MRFNPNDANRFPSPGNWLAEILAIIKADENFSPPGKIINEAKKPALFMSNKARPPFTSHLTPPTYEPGSVQNLIKFFKGGIPEPNAMGPHKGPLMDVVVSELKRLKKLKPGAERRFVRNAILQDFRKSEMLHSITRDQAGGIFAKKNHLLGFDINMNRGNWTSSGIDYWNENRHAKYAGKFLDSMKNLSKSRSLLGLGALAGVGIMAMGNMGNEA